MGIEGNIQREHPDAWKKTPVSEMTLRDYFAAKAMQGLLARPAWLDDVAKLAYEQADAMMKERTK